MTTHFYFSIFEQFTGMLGLEAAALGVLDAEDVDLVEPVHLLQKDEGQDGVRAQAEVVWEEALPQAEEALVPRHLGDHVDGPLVLGLPVDHLHVLDPAKIIFVFQPTKGKRERARN